MATHADLLPYKRRLNLDRRWGLDEAGPHFEGKSGVQKALRAITRRLEVLGVPHVVVGGMAQYAHGFQRFTTDVNLLVTREGLKLIHEKLDGLGYLSPFKGSRQFRDTENGVRVEFLVAGEYPGDGLPKPVAFPDPAEVGVDIDGIRHLNLPTLVEPKLASGDDRGRESNERPDRCGRLAERLRRRPVPLRHETLPRTLGGRPGQPRRPPVSEPAAPSP